MQVVVTILIEQVEDDACARQIAERAVELVKAGFTYNEVTLLEWDN